MMLAGERAYGGTGDKDDAGEIASSAACVAGGAFTGAVLGIAGACFGALGPTWRPVQRPSAAE